MKTVLLMLFYSFLIQAQNLVPNPSFEDTVNCPKTPNQLNRAKFWSTPTQGSPDYYNSCDPTIWAQNVPYTGFGFQNARTGSAYAGLYAFQKGLTNFREYIQSKLSDTLIAGKQYVVSFNVNLTDYSKYSVSSMGAYLSATPISSTNSVVLSYVPQIRSDSTMPLSDTVNWMPITDTLLSDGTEQFITIGNFRADTQSDTLLNSQIVGGNYAYYYIDDVSVLEIDGSGVKSVLNESMYVYPNPANDLLIVKSSDIRGKISVIDLLGNYVMQKPFDVKEDLDLSALPVGIYFLKIESKKETFIQKFVKE